MERCVAAYCVIPVTSAPKKDIRACWAARN
jgi:hypothetical protein